MMNLLRKYSLLVFASLAGLFYSASSFAQVALEDRSPDWPSGYFDMYARILGQTIGTLFILLIIFAVLFGVLKKRKKTKQFLATYSALYAGLIALLYFPTVSGVSEFLRLCNTLAGFHGEPIPKGSGLFIDTNLTFGCSKSCNLSLDSNHTFIEGYAFAVEAPSYHVVQYPPGKYRVEIKDGESEFCKDRYKRNVEEKRGNTYVVVGTYCYHFTRINEFTAEYKAERILARDLTSASGIMGGVNQLIKIDTDEVVAWAGNFEHSLGFIDLSDFPNLTNPGLKVAECGDRTALSRMYGKVPGLVE